jgi:hypothetical protein
MIFLVVQLGAHLFKPTTVSDTDHEPTAEVVPDELSTRLPYRTGNRDISQYPHSENTSHN